MKRIQVACAAILAAVMIGGCNQSTPETEQLGPLTARELGAIPSSPTAEDRVAMGDLVSVDLTAKTLTIRVDGFDQEFGYNDATMVTGRAGRIQGLVGRNGRPVTVHYRQVDDIRFAVEIELE